MSLKFGNYEAPSTRKSIDIKTFRKEDKKENIKLTDNFFEICKQSKEYVYKIYDQKVEQRANGNTQEDYVDIYHNAMKGIPASVNLIKKHIEDFIIENGLRDTEFPTYYKSLVDGLFEEEFGWGPLSCYRYEHESEGAQVIGTDIKFKRSWGWELQPFQFRNLDKVFELAQRFSNMDNKTLLNEHSSPEKETRTYDNIRVSIMIPERMHMEPAITLRKKVIKELSFEMLASSGTLPYESIPVFKSLARFNVNSVIAGPPGCGKSTMLQTILHHALYEMRNGVKQPERINTVYAETNPEWDVRTLHPRSNCFHLLGRGEEFENIITASILRHDISRVVLGEIREHEVGLYRRASLQGIKQVMGTLHDLDPVEIPNIMSNLYMQYYPNAMNAKDVYYSFARNLHFSISMDEFLFVDNGTERLEKKVTGIHLYSIDEREKIKLHTIMEYDIYNKRWMFNSEIPAKFKRLVEKYHYQEFQVFVSTLKDLENKSLVKTEQYI
ncbi:ATPase, T2SS/T4P/T4SS family [Bacillus mesophilum]|uniref:Bacterial type II secretion system protein E domain-containing protein n=1 Tax=Bacillus mesophilum TaxID=1071718 RepID=A0A7V7USU0_9BACI|nr:ATPase, T2SS/T4P/T4SS family [Bacillus mesophilum]KAB2329453.1 hypothetical protein F7732_21245 [Bacillus mesophilum]